MVAFTRRYSSPPICPLRVHGTVLVLKDEMNFLRLVLDKKLNWKSNVNNILMEACIALYTCNKVLRKKLGYLSRITHWIYTAVAR